MLRWVGRVIFLVLSAMLVVWVVEGLTGVDQSQSILPFATGEGRMGIVIFGGVAWGILLPFVGDFTGRNTTGRRARARMTAFAVATVTAARRTGLEINDVPMYEIDLAVSPAHGAAFTGRLKSLMDAEEQRVIVPGAPLPVRYDPNDVGLLAAADASDPEVEAALLQWRIEKGLIDPRLVRARTHGVSTPASVLELRPTGSRKEGQVEVAVRLLVVPEGRPGWEAETTAWLYPDALPLVQVGSPVYARYEPHNPQVVALTLAPTEA